MSKIKNHRKECFNNLDLEDMRQPPLFYRNRLVFSLLLLTLVYLAVDFSRPDLLLVGPVTIDVFSDGKKSPGGSITYAAAVAKTYGINACIVTANPDAGIEVLEGHDVTIVPSSNTQTFEHQYIYRPAWKKWWNWERQLRLQAQPNVTLSYSHVPWRCRHARVVMLGPLMPDDVDATSFKQSLLPRLFFPQHIGLMGQGYQRDADASGKVYSHSEAHQNLLAGLGPGVTSFLSDVETDPWTSPTLAEVAQMADIFVVTKGGDGATEITAYGSTDIPALRVEVLNTNGAGDTFATAYMLAKLRGARNPGEEASFAASRAVMQPQQCKPGCIGVEMREFDIPGWGSAGGLYRDGMAAINGVLQVAHLRAQSVLYGSKVGEDQEMAPVVEGQRNIFGIKFPKVLEAKQGTQNVVTK